MVKVTVGNDSIIINLSEPKKILAIKSKIVIPLKNITKVSTEQVNPLAAEKQDRNACAGHFYSRNILAEKRR
ncbi:MAG TPA: hypothetical protein VNI77_11110 [Nitrososphaera sp.]|nr:hypothetical protein [Nitrososphaera sp.]